MKEDYIYEEKLSSKRTTILFIILALSFLLLFLFRKMAGGRLLLAFLSLHLLCFQLQDAHHPTDS